MLSCPTVAFFPTFISLPSLSLPSLFLTSLSVSMMPPRQPLKSVKRHIAIRNSRTTFRIIPNLRLDEHE